MSQQPGGPQGQNFGQNYQHNNPPEGYAPSAYSAPQPGQPGYGQQPGYAHQPGFGGPGGFPQQQGGFASLFSTNFAQRATPGLVKILMLLGIVAFGIFAGYALFDLLTLLTAGNEYASPGAMTIVTGIIHFAYRVAIGLVLLGLLRVILEYVNRSDKKADS